MSWKHKIDSAIKHSDERDALCDELGSELLTASKSGNQSLAAMFRLRLRLLKRIEQWEEGVLGVGDLLAIIRDYLLFVGGPVSLPKGMSKFKGDFDKFGLFVMDNGLSREVNVGMSAPPNFPHPRYLRDVYQRIPGVGNGQWKSLGDQHLMSVTGFKQYRSLEQKTAVYTCLNMPFGSTLLVSLPTGAGKSLVTWMVAAKSRGLTILVVPTIALALDQYRAAQHVTVDGQRPLSMVYWKAGMDDREQSDILRQIEQQTLELLIVSPEALSRNRRLRGIIVNSAETNYLKYLVIDEAHIVYDWGSFFRPDFQVVASLRRLLINKGYDGKVLRTVLLSATITDSAERHLRQLFSDESMEWIVLRGDSLRTEPRYLMESISTPSDHVNRICQLVRLLPKPLILYDVTRDSANKWQEELWKDGFRNTAVFSGDTDDQERKRIISAWSNDEIDIVIGTSAFGMGVDKIDVRSVVHASIPENINRFYQEVGRGGRDGLASLSMLSHCATEFQISLGSKLLTIEKLALRWQSMLHNALQVDGKNVLLNAGSIPSYFDMKKQNAGQRNLRWNMQVLFFLAKYKFIQIIGVDYDSQHSTYTVWVTLQQVKIMQNVESLSRKLKEPHRREAEEFRQGFLLMKRLVDSGEKVCIGYDVAEMFPNAEPSCGGCMKNHVPYSKDPRFLLRKKIPLYSKMSDSTVSPGWRKVLVFRADNAKLTGPDVRVIALKFNQLNYKAVASDGGSAAAPWDEFEGLTLGIDEFLHISQYHRSLLSDGVVVFFTGDRERDELIFDETQSLGSHGMPIVYVAWKNTRVGREQKTLANLLDARIVTYKEVMGLAVEAKRGEKNV